MEGRSHRYRTCRPLHTATAITNPVLVRLRGHRETTILLAADMTHDHAGAIHLRGVRFVRTRQGVRGLFSGPITGTASDVTLKTSGKERVCIIPRQPYMRVSDTSRGFRPIDLSRQQFLRYQRLSSRRLLRSGTKLERVPRATFIEKALSSAVRVPHMVRQMFSTRQLSASA